MANTVKISLEKENKNRSTMKTTAQLSITTPLDSTSLGETLHPVWHVRVCARVCVLAYERERGCNTPWNVSEYQTIRLANAQARTHRALGVKGHSNNTWNYVKWVALPTVLHYLLRDPFFFFKINALSFCSTKPEWTHRDSNRFSEAYILRQRNSKQTI